MYRGQKVGVSIPAYNEETQVGRVIETMPDFVDLMVIVDDSSKDRTVEIVRQYMQNNPKIVLIENVKNMGVGGASCRGYKEALKQGMDAVAIMAGDAQMHPEDLPALLDPIVDGLADYTKGNRLGNPDVWKVMPKYRFIGNHLLSLMSKFASGFWHINDSQGGYTVINRQTLEELDLDLIGKGYIFENSMLVELNLLNKRVINVPITPVYNVGEQSKIRLMRVSIEMLVYLSGAFFSRIWRKYIKR